MNKGVLFAGGLFLFGSATYASLLLNAKQKPTNQPTNNVIQSTNDGTKAIYNSIARKYDSEVNLDERLIGITKLRRETISEFVKGPNVLEIATGTGRNFDVFWNNREKYNTVTCTDYSKEMLQEAFEKYDRKKDVKKQFLYKVVDAHEVSKHLPNDHFDTVIDTYGLCSFHDPKQVVTEMSRLCKENGRLIFIEHGRSSKWNFMSKLLDQSAPSHYEKWGCWWNKDILKIFEDCSDVMTIERVDTYQFGTCYRVIAKPKKIKK
ncbi:hypothetical protein AKO1_009980, partial [Acrasis kona]